MLYISCKKYLYKKITHSEDMGFFNVHQVIIFHDIANDEPGYCRFDNLVVPIYLLVTTILNNASRNFIHYITVVESNSEKH